MSPPLSDVDWFGVILSPPPPVFLFRWAQPNVVALRSQHPTLGVALPVTPSLSPFCFCPSINCPPIFSSPAKICSQPVAFFPKPFLFPALFSTFSFLVPPLRGWFFLTSLAIITARLSLPQAVGSCRTGPPYSKIGSLPPPLLGTLVLSAFLSTCHAWRFLLRTFFPHTTSAHFDSPQISCKTPFGLGRFELCSLTIETLAPSLIFSPCR